MKGRRGKTVMRKEKEMETEGQKETKDREHRGRNGRDEKKKQGET